MRPSLIALITPLAPVLAASTFLTAPAHAVPQPNAVTAVCADGATYTGTAGSPMASSAHLVGPDGRPATVTVKAAEGYPSFSGVPRRLLTRCDVYVNGTYFIDGYLLIGGPGV